MGIFDFHKETPKVTWDVEGLLPSASLNLFVGKAGTGKSFLVEYLAVCRVYGYNFLTFPTEPCNVLLIDQDTPRDVLDRRLKAFAKYFEGKGCKLKRKLYLHSMEGYTFTDGSLSRIVKKCDDASMVIIDSLHSVAGKLDVNKTKDMTVLSKFKAEVVGEDRTLILVHHISEHSPIGSDGIMLMNDVNKLTMGSSVINQSADTIFYVASKAKSKLKDLFIRPFPKRFTLEFNEPFVVRLIEKDDGSMLFYPKGYYSDIRKTTLYEVDKDILELFKNTKKSLKVNEVYNSMGQKYTMWAVRNSLKRLTENGYLIEYKKSPKLFEYSLKERYL